MQGIPAAPPYVETNIAEPSKDIELKLKFRGTFSNNTETWLLENYPRNAGKILYHNTILNQSLDMLASSGSGGDNATEIGYHNMLDIEHHYESILVFMKQDRRDYDENMIEQDALRLIHGPGSYHKYLEHNKIILRTALESLKRIRMN